MTNSNERDIELGRQEILAGEPELARDRFNALLDLDPECAAANDGLARVALSLGDLDEAVKRCGGAVKMEPENPDFINTLCLAWFGHGDQVGAIELLMQTANRHPEHSQIHLDLADMLSAIKSNEMAFEVLEQNIDATAEVDNETKADRALDKAAALIDFVLAGQDAVRH